MRKYAFLPGALMIVAGVIWAALALRWGVPAVTLAVGGLLALIVGVAANSREIWAWLADPRGVFVLNSALSTMMLVAALVLINARVGLRGVTLDWTEAGRNTLAPETVGIVEHLGEDVTLTQFGRTRDPGLGRLLEAFAARSQRLRVGFVDLDASPQTAREFGVTVAGTVVVSSQRRFRRVERVTEPALATSIVQVTSPVEPVVCFAAGEGEHALADTGPQGLSDLASVLTASNYAPRPVSLLQGGVPPDCAALVIAGLPGGLAPEALVRVEAYLAHGGRIGLALDPPVDPGIAAWARRLGIAVGQGLIIETSGAGRAVGAGPENPVSFAYHDHPITRGFDERTIFGRAVPLALAPTEIGDPKPLVSTADTAFERTDLLSQATEFREGRDRKGPFLLGVASSIARGSRDATLPEPRVVVFGDSDFLANGLITWTANRDLAVRTVAWLAGVEEARVVTAGERQNRRIPLTERRRMAMYLVNIGLLPLLPLVAGLAMGIVSRRQRACNDGQKRPQP